MQPVLGGQKIQQHNFCLAISGITVSLPIIYYPIRSVRLDYEHEVAADAD